MTNNVNTSKRNFLRGRSTVKAKRLRLPWVISEQTFLDDCTKCGDCISRCEENIITTDSDGFPTIDFNLGECTFCEDCIEVCQQTFFKENRNEKAWSTTFNIKENCLAQNKVYCQSCKDVCDSRAINFKFLNGSIPVPTVEPDLCNSCGACIQTCPSDSTELLLL